MPSRNIVVISLLLMAFVGGAVWLAGCGNSGIVGYHVDSAPAPGDAPASAGPARRLGSPATTDKRLLSRAGRHLRETAPPGSLPALDEEVWVIVPPDAAEAGPNKSDDLPGTGALVGRFAGDTESKDVPLPLQHTNVNASITAYIASVNVTQQFHNPYDEKIEAVYVFPLPQNAAVNEFVMRIGERTIRGIIRDREEAEEIYTEAKRQGYVASLLTQERPNVFTQSVANIEPLKQIDIDITYFHTLAYDDGWYEFVYPMVVGPRFNPPGSTGGIDAVARGGVPNSNQSTAVSYLGPNERSGHDIALSVTIDAGVKIEEIQCHSHVVMATTPDSAQSMVVLSPLDAIPNKDFVLRYRVAGDTVKTNLLASRDESGGYFTLMLYPPRELDMLQRAPIEMVFVVDGSGSMDGAPLRLAQRAIKRALRQLGPDDTFQVIRFSNDSSTLGPRPVIASASNVQRGIAYVDALRADGGTMMITGIRAALDYPADAERTRYVTFMTDGYIGNEADILEAVHDRLGDTRIFSFGIGSSPNRYLLNRMAKLGQGAVAYVGLEDDAADIMDRFVARISHPALADLEIDWGDLEVHDVMPARLPDLFVGRPVLVTGRFDSGVDATAIQIRGDVADQRVQTTIQFDVEQHRATHRQMAAVWARSYIADLMDRATFEHNRELPAQIRRLALDYNLMSAYTAFLAVDSSRVTEGGQGTVVPVAVPVPDGVRYDTTVAEAGRER